jgi:hypothetical protein
VQRSLVAGQLIVPASVASDAGNAAPRPKPEAESETKASTVASTLVSIVIVWSPAATGEPSIVATASV